MRFLKQWPCLATCPDCGLLALTTRADSLQAKTDKGKVQGKLSQQPARAVWTLRPSRAGGRVNASRCGHLESDESNGRARMDETEYPRARRQSEECDNLRQIGRHLLGERDAAFRSRGLSFRPCSVRESIEPVWALAMFAGTAIPSSRPKPRSASCRLGARCISSTTSPANFTPPQVSRSKAFPVNR
jgi:hypothetical protein